MFDAQPGTSFTAVVLYSTHVRVHVGSENFWQVIPRTSGINRSCCVKVTLKPDMIADFLSRAQTRHCQVGWGILWFGFLLTS